MKTLGNYKKITFDSIEEIKDTFKSGYYGDIFYYNDWTGEYYPVMYDEETDELTIHILGEKIEGEMGADLLEYIYGYEQIIL